MKTVLLLIVIAVVLQVPLAAASIINGDFEAGNAGFTSAYTYVAPAPNALYPEGIYTIFTDPHGVHDAFWSFGDHTTGTGNMMIVNGSSTTGIPVWQGQLTPGTDLLVGNTYQFSAWVASVYPESPAQLTFLVDGVEIATLSPSPTPTWERLQGTFTAATAHPTFELVNANPALSGNDFAIDDIDVSQVPEPGSLGLIGLGLTAVAAVGRRFRK